MMQIKLAISVRVVKKVTILTSSSANKIEQRNDEMYVNIIRLLPIILNIAYEVMKMFSG